MRNERHIDKFYYILTQGYFYEPFENKYIPGKEFLRIIEHLLIKNKNYSKIKRIGLWFYAEIKDITLPEQGWKIHISATLNNAELILYKVGKLLINYNIPFKFILDKKLLMMINYKNWDRGSSGKFITIYPKQNEFKKILKKLYKELIGQEGPYILSDKRYKDSKVIYYRYGGIKQTTMLSVTGEKILVISSPNGKYIPDIRTPYFEPPKWVKNPFSNNNTIKENIITLNKNRYLIKQALSFSNTGGVYLAKDMKKNRLVVIKEARPHTSMEEKTNDDAVSRLIKEYAILELLNKTGVAPKPVDLFYEWEHMFLVEEYIKGINLRELMLKLNPLLVINPTLNQTNSFYKAYQQLFLNFTRSLNIIHNKGIVLGDLSAYNFIINPKTYNLKIIDFEGAFRVGIDKPTSLYTIGFRNINNVLKNKQTYHDDLYTLGLLMFYCLFPINSMSEVKKDLYDKTLQTILKDLGWPTKIFHTINCLLKEKIDYNKVIFCLKKKTQLKKPRIKYNIKKNEIKNMVEKFGQFILNNLENDKKDKLFPADPFLYKTNPLSLGFGATGILYSLKKCGFEIPQKAYDWLKIMLKRVTPDDYPPGILTGTSGISWILWELGYNKYSFKIMEITNKHRLLTANHSLFYGAAGIGMTNIFLYIMSKQLKYLDMAVCIGDVLLNKAKNNKKGIFWQEGNTIYIGYGYGQSGVGLFLLRLYQLTHNDKYLNYGKKALAFDISYFKKIEKGVLSVTESTNDINTYEPYIECGSGGIAKVMMRYGMWEKISSILNDVHRKYSVFCGLLFGLASFIDVLTDAYIYSKDIKYLKMACKPLQGIKELYLIKTPYGYATPGDSLFRISCDYATGVAGVMRTLHRYLTKDSADFTLDDLR